MHALPWDWNWAGLSSWDFAFQLLTAFFVLCLVITLVKRALGVLMLAVIGLGRVIRWLWRNA
jgi:hypothetical protein